MDLIEPGESLLQLRSAALAAAALRRRQADLVAEIDDLVDLLRVVVPGRDPGRDDPSQLLPATADAGIDSNREVGLGLRMDVGQRPIRVPAQVCLVHPADQLDVLPGHPGEYPPNPTL